MSTTIESLLLRVQDHWEDAPVLSRLGQELEDRSRFRPARRALERTLALDPGDLAAWIYLAYLHFRDLRAAEGLEILRRGARETGADVLRAILAGFADEQEAEPIRQALASTKDVAARAQLTSQRFNRGEAAALDELRALAHDHPEDAVVLDAWLWTLLGARNAGRVPGLDLRREGIPQATRLIEAAPEFVRGWLMKLTMLAAEKDWAGVLEASAAALVAMPDEETIMQARGRAFREAGDLDRAAAWFLRAIGAKPSFVGARIDLGRLHEAAKRLEVAEEIFREIPVANPDYPLAPVSLALFLARRERWDEAERWFLGAWPKIPDFFRGGLKQNPAAAALLARPAIAAALTA